MHWQAPSRPAFLSLHARQLGLATVAMATTAGHGLWRSKTRESLLQTRSSCFRLEGGAVQKVVERVVLVGHHQGRTDLQVGAQDASCKGAGARHHSDTRIGRQNKVEQSGSAALTACLRCMQSSSRITVSASTRHTPTEDLPVPACNATVDQ